MITTIMDWLCKVIKCYIACCHHIYYLPHLSITFYFHLYFPVSQVEVMNKADKSQKTETAFRLFDKNKDGFITREEFTKVSGSDNGFYLFHCQSLFTGFQKVK